MILIVSFYEKFIPYANPNGRFKVRGCYMDNGCTHNFVSHEFAKKANLRTQDAPYAYEIELADGKEAQSWGEFAAKVPVFIQDYEDLLDFDFMKISRYDAIWG